MSEFKEILTKIAEKYENTRVETSDKSCSTYLYIRFNGLVTRKDWLKIRISNHEAVANFSKADIDFILTYNEDGIHVKEDECNLDFSELESFGNIIVDNDWEDITIEGHDLTDFQVLVAKTIEKTIKELTTY